MFVCLFVCDCDIVPMKLGMTALLEASVGGHVNMVVLLINSGANVNHKNKVNYSVLM